MRRRARTYDFITRASHFRLSRDKYFKAFCLLFFNRIYFYKYQNVQILKILSAWTLKNSQSSVTLKNECKQLRYYFTNEIKNSTHPNDKILRLKQQANFKTIHKNTLREKRPNTELFLVLIFLYSDWIRRDTPYVYVFSRNTGKYGPEKLRIWTLFTEWYIHKSVCL